MGKRVLVAVIFIPLLLVVIYVLPPLGLPVLISALSMVAVHEVLWSTGFVKNARLSGYSILLSGVIPFWVYFHEGMLPALCGLLLYLTLVFIEAISSRFTVTLEKMGGAFFFAVLIPYFLSSFLRLRVLDGVGEYLVILPLVIAFTSDAFALFAGMLFGKHKLAPELSPKKTVEGAAGGLIGAVACSMFYGLLLTLFFEVKTNYLLMALFGAAGSVFSQLGDLSFSYIKRQYQIKDFGSILPGHGGVLDRFDSVIFCTPLIELLCTLLPALAVVQPL